MAKTVINLADPISTLVFKTNTISGHLGDLTQLNVGASNDSDMVQAMNYVNEIVQKTDSDDIINRIITTDYVRGKFQSDSANGIILDSGDGTFSIPSNVINTAMLETNSVTTPKITNSNITTDKIANSNVTTAKIADLNVTTGKIANSGVTTAKIADLNVTTGKLATNAVTTAKITNANVTVDKMASNSVDTVLAI